MSAGKAMLVACAAAVAAAKTAPCGECWKQYLYPSSAVAAGPYWSEVGYGKTPM